MSVMVFLINLQAAALRVAGRYPVARTRREYISSASNPHELLDYGSAHPVMKIFFERARKELESKLPGPISNRFESLVVTRQGRLAL